MTRAEYVTRVMLQMASIVNARDRFRHAGVGQLALQVGVTDWRQS